MFLKQRFRLATIVFLCMLLASLAGCCSGGTSPEYADSPAGGKETIVQVSTIGALLNGAYDGVMSIGTLRAYGGFGIGTFDGLDGEMIAFDGGFYQVKADGVACQVPDTMETPFACVTSFEADREEHLPRGMDYEQVGDFLDAMLPTPNIFYAIRIEGSFDYMKTRSVPRQEKPYPPLAEVTKNQAVFEFNGVEGTVVGLRCPVYVEGINVPGYHLHFLTEQRDAGGHVLEFEVEEAIASVDYTSAFLMILPGEGSDFYEIDLTREGNGEVEEVEK